MTYETPHLRKHIHLSPETYDQNGSVFITVCTQNRRPLLGTIHEDTMVLSPCGLIVAACIEQMTTNHSSLQIPHSVIMPNHVHLLVSRIRTARGKIISLSQFVSQLKGRCSKEYGMPIWQRGYYDHVIRSEEDRLQIIEYIQNNPRKWSLDQEYIEK